jgi:hemerythrin
MPFFEWIDSYNIGVKEIDIQHRGLFDIISKLFTSRTYEPDGKYFILTLSKFLEYAQVHFSTEERYMEESMYPTRAEHRNEHERFLTEAAQFVQTVERKEPGAENRTLEFLKNWYLNHILGTDRDLEKWFQAKGFK